MSAITQIASSNDPYITYSNGQPNNRFHISSESIEQQKTQILARSKLSPDQIQKAEQHVWDILNSKNTIDSLLTTNPSDAFQNILTSLKENNLDKNHKAYLYQRKAELLSLQEKYDEAISAAYDGKRCAPNISGISIALNICLIHALQKISNDQTREENIKQAILCIDDCLANPTLTQLQLQSIIHWKLSLLRNGNTAQAYFDFIQCCLETYTLDENFRNTLQQNKILALFEFGHYPLALLALLEFQKMHEETSFSEEIYDFIYKKQIEIIQKIIDETLSKKPTSIKLAIPKNLSSCLLLIESSKKSANYSNILFYVYQGLILTWETNNYPTNLIIPALIAFNSLQNYQTAFLIAESVLRIHLYKDKNKTISATDHTELAIQKITALMEFEKTKEGSSQNFDEVFSFIENALKLKMSVPMSGRLYLIKADLFNYLSQFQNTINCITGLALLKFSDTIRATLDLKLAEAFHYSGNPVQSATVFNNINFKKLPPRAQRLYNEVHDIILTSLEISSSPQSGEPKFKVPELPSSKTGNKRKAETEKPDESN